MLSLKNILVEISANSTLYHRSIHIFKVGDTIKPYKGSDGKHFNEKDEFEQALEYARQLKFKDIVGDIYSSDMKKSGIFNIEKNLKKL